MGNYRTRVHLTDNATGWDQWQRGDWPVWSSTITSFSLCETELSRSNRKQTSRRRLSVVILMPRFCKAWAASHRKHHMLQYAKASRALQSRVRGPHNLRFTKCPFCICISSPETHVCAHPIFSWSIYEKKKRSQTLGSTLRPPRRGKGTCVRACLCVWRSLWGTQ